MTNMSQKAISKTVTINEQELRRLKRLEEICLYRYCIQRGISYISKLLMVKTKEENQKLRKLKSELRELLEEAEKTRKFDIEKYVELKKEIEQVRQKRAEKAKPYQERLRPLRIQLKHLDTIIVSILGVDRIKPITNINEIPKELQAPQP